MILLALLTTLAQAAPQDVLHQGRLLDAAGNPINATVTVDIGLYSSATSQSPVWLDSYTDIPVQDGYYTLRLPGAALSSDATWLDIAVDGQRLPPRQELGSVPVANAVNGPVNATSVVVNGQTVINTAGQIAYDRIAGAPEDALSALNCGDNSYPINGATGWACKSELTRRALGSLPIPLNAYNGTPSTWTQVNPAVATGWSFGDYNTYLRSGESLQIRMCMSYTDSGDNGGKINVRFRRDSPSQVLYTLVFSNSWSASGLIHNDCSGWTNASTLGVCGYGWGSTCIIEIEHTQDRNTRLFGAHFEMSALVP